MHAELNKCINGVQDEIEQLKAHRHGQIRDVGNGLTILSETKSTEQRRIIDKKREQTECHSNMRERNDQELRGMCVDPMAELMGEHSLDFRRRRLFNKSVEDDNVLATAGNDAIEVGIRMAAPLAAIDHVQVLERELERGCQRCDAIAKHALLQWRQLVEQGLDQRRVDDRAEQDERREKKHRVHDKGISSPTYNRDDQRHDRHTQYHT